MAEDATKKKQRIRLAGLRTERKFFGPRGIFAKSGHTKHLKNPPLFEYQDARGVWQIGTMEKYVDLGGTDHVAYMRRATGELDLVSGSRLKAMKTIQAKSNPVGGPFDKDAARELELYARNNADLYRQMEVPIRLNLEKKYKKGIYQSILAVKLWQGWADEAAKRYNKEFGGGGSKWFEMFSPSTRLHVAKEQEMFHREEMDLGNFQVVNKNPRMLECLQCGRRTAGKALQHYEGCPQLKFIQTYGKPKKNPITVIGNPPKRINTTVAGVLYNRCVEVRAEKTGAGSLKGFYYHPFKRDSQVCILALDNGDLLIHSKAGERLWKVD